MSVSMGEVQTWKRPEWRNRTSDCESDDRFWIGKPGFLSKFTRNHRSISFGVGDIRVWHTHRRTDRRTDRWTTHTITIAGPHIVADQLIRSKDWNAKPFKTIFTVRTSSDALVSGMLWWQSKQPFRVTCAASIINHSVFNKTCLLTKPTLYC